MGLVAPVTSARGGRMLVKRPGPHGHVDMLATAVASALTMRPLARPATSQPAELGRCINASPIRTMAPGRMRSLNVKPFGANTTIVDPC